MTASFRSITASTIQTGTSGSMSMTVPTGTLAGELEFVAVHAYTSSSGTFTLTVTPPAGQGWTLVAQQGTTYTPNTVISLWKRLAPASNTTQVFTWSSTGSVSGARAARITFTGANVVGGIEGVASAGSTSPLTITSTMAAPDLLVAFMSQNAGTPPPTPSGWTARTSFLGTALVDRSPGAAGTYSVTATQAGQVMAGVMFGILPPNSAPNAPAWATAQGQIVDAAADQVLDWDFSDPDPGDSQSQFVLDRWALDSGGARVGAAVRVVQSTPVTSYTIPGGSLVAGTQYEFKVATRDSQGVPVSDASLLFSESLFMTFTAKPSAPTITAPANGATVAVTDTLTWSTPNQDAYQVQQLDGSGVLVPGTDTGEVTDSTIRSVILSFPTNNVPRTIQVRRKYGGLWSEWATVAVNVSWTPPADPVVAVTPDAATASITVAITNPAPGAGEPTVAYNVVYLSAAGVPEFRAATMVPANSTWRFWTPTSGLAYTARVVAVASNGTTAETIVA